MILMSTKGNESNVLNELLPHPPYPPFTKTTNDLLSTRK